jgi:hypothetical protein
MPRFKSTANHKSIYVKTVGFTLSLEDYFRLRRLVERLSEERWGRERRRVTVAEFLRGLVKEALREYKD